MIEWKQRSLFTLGPVLFSTLDALVTLRQQPVDYWAGEFSVAVEANPIGYWFLSTGPSWFALAMVFWIAIFGCLIFGLPTFWARVLAMVVMSSHAFGLSTWLFQFSNGYILIVLAFVLLRIVAIPVWDFPSRLRSSDLKSNR